MKINGRPLLELPPRNVYLKRIKYVAFKTTGLCCDVVKAWRRRAGGWGWSKGLRLPRQWQLSTASWPLTDACAPLLFASRSRRFMPEEQRIYDALDAASKKIFQEYVRDNTLVRQRARPDRACLQVLTSAKWVCACSHQSANVAHVLVILTRLRQLCDHPSLFMADKDLYEALSHPTEYLQGDHPPEANSDSGPSREEVCACAGGRVHGSSGGRAGR